MQNEGIAIALHDVWGYIGLSPSKYTLNATMHYTEPVVHEICHAASLGFPLTKKAPERTSTYFEDLNTRSRVLGLITEAHAFAIEQKVLKHFGWLRYVKYTELMRDIHRTGYSGPCLSWNDFLSLYRRFMREEETGDMAKKAIGYIYEVTKGQINEPLLEGRSAGRSASRGSERAA